MMKVTSVYHCPECHAVTVELDDRKIPRDKVNHRPDCPKKPES